MSKELIISSTPEESIAGIVQDGEVVDIYIEREKHRSMVSNIYKGRVQRVLPGMQAAFVDVGLERDGFLYVGDFYEEMGDVELEEPQQPPHATSIEEMLKPGQQILVQVAKGPIAAKGARLTSHITMPGRYVVYMPTVTHLGVSRKIESSEERSRLRSIVKRHRGASGGGFIVRTAAEGLPEEELVADLELLGRNWEEIRKKEARVQAPACIHRDLGLTQKLMRDVVRSDLAAIRIDNEEEFLRCVEMLETINPAMTRRMRLHQRDADILDDYGLTEELENSLKSKVWLRSGGYLVINQTEALVAIDVNTGKFIGKKSLEETIFQTNMEAVKEVARQIRLRHLGGIIVVDLIDMENRKNRRKVMDALDSYLKKDRQPATMLPVPDLGLALITRKRVQSSVEKTLCQPCPYCSGSGQVRSAETVAFGIARELRKKSRALGGGDCLIRVHPDVAHTMKSLEREMLASLERTLQRQIVVRSDPGLHREQYHIGTTSN